MEELIASLRDWHIYLIIGVALCALEIFVSGFFLLPIGLAFMVTAPIAAYVDPLWLELIILSALSVVFFFAMGFLRKAAGIKTTVDGMTGKEATVTHEIGEYPGQVKLYGDTFGAISESKEKFSEGEVVIIERVEGNRVFVKKKNN